MVFCIFTIDYEIYGNGQGRLSELVYEPTERLITLFAEFESKFVAFVEALEMESISSQRSDPAIEQVQNQISRMHEQGFEIGLHLHPQWRNGKFVNGEWHLDYSEYNLCLLGRERIAQIVQAAIHYLRKVLRDPGFTPLSFRAGNWLFQPTATAAAVLHEQGIKIDSSVFKGGRQRAHNLDYRRALKNGYYWSFSKDAQIPDPGGRMLEMPIYTRMVPFWKMFTRKRFALQQKGIGARNKKPRRLPRLVRLSDYLRLTYPLKLDFCRMTINEWRSVFDAVIADDKKSPESLKPIVAIGHSKDLNDFETIKQLLLYLKTKNVSIGTFGDAFGMCQHESAEVAGVSVGKEYQQTGTIK